MSDRHDPERSQILLQLIRGNQLQAIESLLNSESGSVKLCNSVSQDGYSMLQWAILNYRGTAIVRLLIQHGANVNYAGGPLSETALHIAAQYDYLHMVQLLVEAGANIELKNVYGWSPFVCACQRANIHSAFVLLCAGASPNVVDVNGNTALHLILKNNDSFFMKKKIELVRLLLRFGADTELQDLSGDNALHCIARTANPNDNRSLFLLFYLLESKELECRGNYLKLLNAKDLNGSSVAEVCAKNKRFVNFLWDYDQFKSLPVTSPIIASWATMQLYPLALYTCGASYGLLISLITFCVYRNYFSQLTILKHGSRTSFGWALGLVSSMLLAHLMYLISHVHIFHTLIFVSVCLVSIYMMVNLYLLKPACLRADDTAKHGNIVSKLCKIREPLNRFEEDEDIESSQLLDAADGTPDALESQMIPAQLCTVCLVDKSLATTHCKNCDACIIDLDHHCHFINACVGKNNRHYFFRFVIASFISGFLFDVFSNRVMLNNYCPTSANVPLSSIFNLAVLRCAFDQCPGLLWTMLSCFASTIWVFTIAVNQLYLVGRETTTYNQLKNKDVPSEKYCFDQKNFMNIYRFLRYGTYNVRTKREASVVVLSSQSTEAKNILLQSEIEKVNNMKAMAARREFSISGIVGKLFRWVTGRPSCPEESGSAGDCHSSHGCCAAHQSQQQSHNDSSSSTNSSNTPMAVGTVLSKSHSLSSGSQQQGIIISISTPSKLV